MKKNIKVYLDKETKDKLDKYCIKNDININKAISNLIKELTKNSGGLYEN